MTETVTLRAIRYCKIAKGNEFEYIFEAGESKQIPLAHKDILLNTGKIEED